MTLEPCHFKKRCLYKNQHCYIFQRLYLQLNDFDRNTLNNNLDVKNYINTFFYYSRLPTSVPFGLFSNNTFFLNDAWAQRPAAKYVCAIMRYSIGYNIIKIANQLSSAYWGLDQEFQVFVSSLPKSTKATDFLCTLKKKQEIW